MHNVIIIGSGPAGYTAAIYTARAALKPLLFSGSQFGGQLMYTTNVENFPGFKEGIMGPKMMMEMRAQAEKFGTKIIDKQVSKVDFSKKPFKVWVNEDNYQAKTIIIATGAEAITLNLGNEKRLMGKGISTCAVCDAAFYQDKIVYVVGGGDSAMEDTLALTKFAQKIFLVVRRDELRASQIMQNRTVKHSKVEILWNTEIINLIGEEKLTGLKIINNKTKAEQEVKADGLFYAIGHKPNSELFINQLQMDEKGYILTSINGLMKNQDLYQIWRESYPTMTSIEGIFATGDVVDFRYRQAITAAGLGCMSALDTEKWLSR